MTQGISVTLEEPLISDIRSNLFATSEGRQLRSLLEEFNANVFPLVPSAAPNERTAKYFWIRGVDQPEQRELLLARLRALPGVRNAEVPPLRYAL